MNFAALPACHSTSRWRQRIAALTNTSNAGTKTTRTFANGTEERIQSIRFLLSLSCLFILSSLPPPFSSDASVLFSMAIDTNPLSGQLLSNRLLNSNGLYSILIPLPCSNPIDSIISPPPLQLQAVLLSLAPSVVAPKLWKSFPKEVRQWLFFNRLKTELYRWPFIPYPTPFIILRALFACAFNDFLLLRTGLYISNIVIVFYSIQYEMPEAGYKWEK